MPFGENKKLNTKTAPLNFETRYTVKKNAQSKSKNDSKKKQKNNVRINRAGGRKKQKNLPLAG
jgi:hypothetical protein